MQMFSSLFLFSDFLSLYSIYKHKCTYAHSLTVPMSMCFFSLALALSLFFSYPLESIAVRFWIHQLLHRSYIYLYATTAAVQSAQPPCKLQLNDYNFLWSAFLMARSKSCPRMKDRLDMAVFFFFLFFSSSWSWYSSLHPLPIEWLHSLLILIPYGALMNNCKSWCLGVTGRTFSVALISRELCAGDQKTEDATFLLLPSLLFGRANEPVWPCTPQIHGVSDNLYSIYRCIPHIFSPFPSLQFTKCLSRPAVCIQSVSPLGRS